MTKRYLAIDPGAKRLGVAVGDDSTRVATPLRVVEIADSDEAVRHIGKIIAEQGPQCLVIGLPLNMDGSEGVAAQRARALAEALGQASGLPIQMVDERLTSRTADASLRSQGLTRRQYKKKQDAVAAAILLQDVLDALAP